MKLLVGVFGLVCILFQAQVIKGGELTAVPVRLACLADTKTCPDGTVVGRNINNKCTFFPCPVVCPPDKPKVYCFDDPCSPLQLQNIDFSTPCFSQYNPYGLICVPNYCGGCHREWYVSYTDATNNIPVDCEGGCSPEKPHSYCTKDPCDVAIPPACYPDAHCQADYCGGCNAMWWFSDNLQYMVDCDLHTCPGGQLWTWCGSPCTATCANPNPVCIKPCAQRCECPPNKPIFENGQCIALKQCGCPSGYTELSSLDCDTGMCPTNVCSGKNKCCLKHVYQGVCQILEHLKKDYLQFITAHKELVTSLDGLSTANRRELLDKIWDVLDCLNDLICKVEKKKKQMQNPDIVEINLTSKSAVAVDVLHPDSPDFRECLMKWIGQIIGKAAELMDLVLRLQELGSDTTRIESLVANCLSRAQELPVAMLAERLTAPARLASLDIDSILSKPIGPFCRKLQELQKLDSAFMSIYSNIYNILWPVFSNNNVTSLFPYSWQYDLCACILNEIRLIEILKKCCKESSNTTDAEMAKKLSKWLKIAMEARERLRKCLGTITVKGTKKMILAIPLDQLLYQGKLKPKKKVAGPVAKKVFKVVGDLLKRFDECIRKMRCLYIDYVKSWWNGRQVVVPRIAMEANDNIVMLEK